MKKTILVCALSAVCMVVVAQTDTQMMSTPNYGNQNNQNSKDQNNRNDDQKTSPDKQYNPSQNQNQNQQDQDMNRNQGQKKSTSQNPREDSPNKECTVQMTNGKVMKMQNGKSVALDQTMTLSNGTM
ncbi:MAG: hypothetical protein HY072_04945, partial [Deltaproteobacteria bacterium]|nr:hypothetical protein [Deltaproteobacteria bacterium]